VFLGLLLSAAGNCCLLQAAAYSASKAALRFYTDALRVELAPFGVHVMHTALGEATA
jgi:short-subunit dehydrogenase